MYLGLESFISVLKRILSVIMVVYPASSGEQPHLKTSSRETAASRYRYFFGHPLSVSRNRTLSLDLPEAAPSLGLPKQATRLDSPNRAPRLVLSWGSSLVSPFLGPPRIGPRLSTFPKRPAIGTLSQPHSWPPSKTTTPGHHFAGAAIRRVAAPANPDAGIYFSTCVGSCSAAA